ncbi:MAG: hypothetical protein M1821_001374 [Bathelium mastoideum]|nr:MAG: hypothetical protein M1821_001374 [Bathelium mastoideum]
MAASFTEIPTLPLAQARHPNTKAAFLENLRAALLNVGFLYLSETGLDEGLVEQVCVEGRKFFEELPTEEKLKIEMKNEKSFLGYSRLGNETTAQRADQREQIDLSTSHDVPSPDAPLYHNLLAPNQWPSSEYLPHFRPIIEEYIRQMSTISIFFTSLIAEALGLPPTAFDRFFDADQQHKLKLIKYPEMTPSLHLPDDAAAAAVGPAVDDEDDDVAESGGSSSKGGKGGRRGSLVAAGHEARAQGVGPHKDSMLTSYLLQASPQRGLQAQNTAGRWIDVPPREGTLVVAMGQGLEALTGGVCASTTHRVLSPLPGEGARYSIPFFQGVSYDARFESMEVPEAVRALRRDVLEKQGGRRDDVEFTFVKGRWGHLGEATLMNRVKSHPDVGERWYPDLLAQIRADQAQQQESGTKGDGLPKDLNS